MSAAIAVAPNALADVKIRFRRGATVLEIVPSPWKPSDGPAHPPRFIGLENGRPVVEANSWFGVVDPVPPRQDSQALLTMLYRSTERRCRRGAPVMYLSDSASFQPSENSAPSKSGTKHLVRRLQSRDG